MPTIDTEIAVLIECVRDLANPFRITHRDLFNEIVSKLDSLSRPDAPDSSAPTPEIELCGKCKQKPCGCKKGDVLDCLRRVHAAGGHAWDNIEDPEQYLREIRGESAPAKCEPCGHPKVTTQWHQPQATWESVLCQSCGMVGRMPYGTNSMLDRDKIEWWPEPVASHDDPVPPWEKNKYWWNQLSIELKFHEQSKYVADLRDTLKRSQNTTAVAVLRELQRTFDEPKGYVQEWVRRKIREMSE